MTDPWHTARWLILGLIIGLLLLILALEIFAAEPPAIGTASWYSVASAKAEGCSGVTASGDPLDDNGYTCASWDYPMGTVLRVTHGDRVVYVLVNDRGPARRLVEQGRIIDLSVRAFRRLAPLSAGVIEVTVEVAK